MGETSEGQPGRPRVAGLVLAGIACLVLVGVLVARSGTKAASDARLPADPAPNPELDALRDELVRVKADRDRVAASASAEATRLREELAALRKQKDELEKRIEELSARVAKETARLNGPSAPPTPAPSGAGTIEGVVQAVDNKVDIAVLSVGKKDGVESGMEFEIRRGTATVATLVIDKVFPNYCSGATKPGTPKSAIAPGDVALRTKPR